jgi:uncharacterized protein (TIGR02996 family)
VARKEPPPTDHTIQRARAETACATCAAPIEADELALAEAYVSTDGKWARSHRYARSPKHVDPMMRGDDDRRYDDGPNADLASRLHHLACAAQHQPYKLRSALKLSGDLIPHRAELEQAILDALSPKDHAETDPATRDEYARFIERLRATTDDDDFLVFGDWLQSVGDPRGELIALQHALETAINEDRARLLDHERKLIAQHHFAPEQPVGQLKWRRGFVRRVYKSTSASRLDHPSLRFLRPADLVAGDEPAPPIELVKPAKAKAGGEWRVRHTRKPEWGIGRVISEDETKGLEISFEHGGVRTVKNVELLEDLDEL